MQGCRSNCSRPGRPGRIQGDAGQDRSQGRARHRPADAARLHCKSLPAQEVRSLLTARKLLQTKNHDVEMSLRGVLRGFGLKVGPTTPRTFAGRIRELVAGHTTLSTIAEALLAARGTLLGQWQLLEKRLRSLARQDRRVRVLMTTLGLGEIVGLPCIGN
jgi:transposase